MGKARLDRAIKTIQDKYEVNIESLPFFLRPHFPLAGIPKHWSQERLQRMNSQVKPLGIKFGAKHATGPNTGKYHVALAHVLKHHGSSAQTKANARIMRAYFQEEVFPNDVNLLALCQESVPKLNAEAFARDLRSEEKLRAVHAHANEIKRDYQVTGVPFYIINDKVAFSGAREPEVFINAFKQAAK